MGFNKGVSFAPIMLSAAILVGGCGNRLASTVSPKYQDEITVVPKIGLTGDGVAAASAAFIETGYNVIDLGNDSTKGIESAKQNGIPYVAVIDSVGTEGSWWDGVFDFSMRVIETVTDSIVWSATAEYGSGGILINQTKSTRKAMKGMVNDFSKHFPPVKKPD